MAQWIFLIGLLENHNLAKKTFNAGNPNIRKLGHKDNFFIEFINKERNLYFILNNEAIKGIYMENL